MTKLRHPLLLSILLHAAVIFGGGILLTQTPQFQMGGASPTFEPSVDTTEVDLVAVLPDEPEVPEEPAVEPIQVPEQMSEMAVPTSIPTRAAPTPTPRPTPIKTRRPSPSVAPTPVAVAPTASVLREEALTGDALPSSQASSPSGPNSTASSSESNGSGTRDAQPDYLRNPPPSYPIESRRAGEEGTVVLKVRITSLGTVEDLSIKRSSGFSRLDAAAEQSVQKWSFRPAFVAGIAVSSTVEVPVTFRLTTQKR
jgi:protein TonB